jgi:predicted alpha/beta-hydrolase family hydrolase
MSQTKIEFDGPKKSRKVVALAHGAGEAWNSAFLQFFTEGIAGLGYRVARFEFPYMAERTTTGRKRPPDREPVLRATWMNVIEQLREKSDKLVIGGKSMGGRIASLVADEGGVDGLVCLGYPFHPTGKPEKLRVEHLANLQTPTLIVQGDRDPFGTKEDVAQYTLSESIEIHWVPDGDHSYKTGRGSERTLDTNLRNALRSFEKFLFPIFVT